MSKFSFSRRHESQSSTLLKKDEKEKFLPFSSMERALNIYLREYWPGYYPVHAKVASEDTFEGILSVMK